MWVCVCVSKKAYKCMCLEIYFYHCCLRDLHTFWKPYCCLSLYLDMNLFVFAWESVCGTVCLIVCINVCRNMFVRVYVEFWVYTTLSKILCCIKFKMFSFRVFIVCVWVIISLTFFFFFYQFVFVFYNQNIFFKYMFVCE